MHNFWRFLVSLLAQFIPNPLSWLWKIYNPNFHCQINFEAKRHGRKGPRMNSVESPSASLCSDGNSPTLTPPSSSASYSAATNPQNARPMPHSLWSKSVEGSESECLIWSGLVSSDLVEPDLVEPDLVWYLIWSDATRCSSCDQTIWWPPLVKEASPYPTPQISTSNSVFRNIFGRCTEMFSQIFSTSISRHSFSFLTVTDATIHGRCAQSESDSFFWLLSPGRACYGTVLAVPYVQNIFQPKILKMFYLRPWRWHWWQCWKGIFVRLEMSGEVRLCTMYTHRADHSNFVLAESFPNYGYAICPILGPWCFSVFLCVFCDCPTFIT